MGMTITEYDNILYRDLVLKLEGFKNRMDYEEEISRKLAYSSYIGPHLDPKKMAKSIDKFWPMGDSGKEKISSEKRLAIKAEIARINANKKQLYTTKE